MSNTKLRSAKYSINQLINTIPLSSYTTRADMRTMLIRCVKDLHQLGYKVGHIKGIKERHVNVLVEHWKKQGKKPGTIKNYMSKLRKSAHYLGNPSIVKPKNSMYQIHVRNNAPAKNRAITCIDWSHCKDDHIRLSIMGQMLFGLRREESLKFILSYAHQGDYLLVKSSWTKGGVGRSIKIRTAEQRQWLNDVGALVKPGNSLIPINKTYKQHLSQYQSQTNAMGLRNCHGLRHAYAQQRYKELTAQFSGNNVGLVPPLICAKRLTPAERKIDDRARHIIARELGHSRKNITKIYLG